jgi:hypothetical protein
MDSAGDIVIREGICLLEVMKKINTFEGFPSVI